MRRGNIKKIKEDKSNEKKIQATDNIKNDEVDSVIRDSALVDDKPKQDEKQNKDKLKIIILIIITVLALGITLSILTYRYLKINQQTGKDSLNNNDITASKNETKDNQYLVSFKDMYTQNPLTVNDENYSKAATSKTGRVEVNYCQISGLKDKNLQEKINNEIKENAFYYTDKITAKQEYNSYTDVLGNFSNILSISTNVYVYEKDNIVLDQVIYLNYNLATGEKIQFLDLFAANTPMNSIIYDMEYERLAWEIGDDVEFYSDEWLKATNMDNRDTSEYEDTILKVINKYKALDKAQINFGVTPNKILLQLPVGDNGKEISYTMQLYRYIDYITMYKKFLTNKEIYESKPKVQFLVFNDFLGYTPEYYKIESDNLFISVLSYIDGEYKEEIEKEEIQSFSQSAVDMKNELMEKFKNNILKQVKQYASTHKNKGYMARFYPYCSVDKYSNEYGGETLIYVSLVGEVEEMNIDYYDENAFRLLAKQNVRPRASIDDALVGRLDYENKNINSLIYNENWEETGLLNLNAYYTLDGKLVANSYEQRDEYIDSKYKEIEAEPEVDSESEQNNQK